LFGSFAEIKVIEGVAAQAVTGTPTKMTGFAANGPAVGCSADHTTDTITLDVAGVYNIDLTVSFSGDASDVYYCAVYVNGSDAGLAYIDRALGVGGAVGSAATGGFLSLSAADEVTVFVWSDTGGTSFVPHQASLRAKRIG
jgi:hypothetical protein